MKTTDIRDDPVSNTNLGIHTEGYVLRGFISKYGVIERDCRFLLEVVCLRICKRKTLTKGMRGAFNEGDIELINRFKRKRFAILYVFKQCFDFGTHGITTFKNYSAVIVFTF